MRIVVKSGCFLAALSACLMTAAVPGRAVAQIVGQPTTGQNPATFNGANIAALQQQAGLTPAGGTAPAGGNARTPGNLPTAQAQASLAALGYGPQPAGNARRVPRQGEAGADGQIVHYRMADKEEGTGYGLLSDVKLPVRSFNVDDEP